MGYRTTRRQMKAKQAPAERKVDRSVVHAKQQQQVLDFMIEVYGDDADVILNALHEMAARVGITSGVSPEDYTAGMKHHWNHLVNAMNRGLQ